MGEVGSQAVPVRVGVDEAVELARRYSGENARRMVNGALGTFTKHQESLRLEPLPRPGYPGKRTKHPPMSLTTLNDALSLRLADLRARIAAAAIRGGRSKRSRSWG